MTETIMRDELLALAERVAPYVKGWRQKGPHPSNGECICTGCWDRSDHNTNADTDIPKREPVFYSTPHPEYGDCDSYCIRCVVEDALDYQLVGPETAAAMLQDIAQHRARTSQGETDQ